MARQKAKLTFIDDHVKRKAAYKKRIEGFINKVSAISTLCGINACAIVYSQYDLMPRIWPNEAGVQSLIEQFINMPPMDRRKKVLNQEEFLKFMVEKINEQLNKQHNKNRDREIIELILQSVVKRETLNNLLEPEINAIRHKLRQKLAEINNRVEGLKNGYPTLRQVSNLLPQPSVAVTAVEQAPSPLTPMLMAVPQVGQPSFIPMGMPQFPAPQMQMVTNNLMQPNMLQVQENGQFSPWLIDWVNQPTNNLQYGQVGENQMITLPMPNDSNMPLPDASYGQGFADDAQNPYAPN